MHADTTIDERDRSVKRLGRSRLLVGMLCAIALFFSLPAHGGVRVHVRGQAKIEPSAARDGDDTLLEGTLSDDAGNPLVGESIVVSLARAVDPSHAISLEGGARFCGPAREREPTPAPAGPSAISLATNEDGRFCARLTVTRDLLVATMSWTGTPFFDPAKTELTLDGHRQSLALSFDPEPRVIDLDNGPLVLKVQASYQDQLTTRAGASVQVVVSDERGTPLAGRPTDERGGAFFSIPAAALGGAGLGQLRASFDGSDELSKSMHSAFIEKHTHVRLEAKAPSAPSSPEDGLPIEVTAHAMAGGVPTGTVEAYLAGSGVVGAAKLEKGGARLTVSFLPLDDEPEAEVLLRYTSNAPWFEPVGDLPIKVPVKGRSPLRHMPLAVAGLAVVGWLLLGRVRRRVLPPESAASAKPAEAEAREGVARVEVLRPARDSRAGWSGRVVDAHDGAPVRGGRVRIERPGFERAAIIAGAVANEAGRFELRSEAGTYDELVVDGPLHSELRQPMPPSGELEIALVLRKRRLLDRMVGWAKRRGRPFDASPEPTPGHVRRAAGADFATARWADAVEKAAFGGGEVDARAEAEVDRLAPDGQKPQDPAMTVIDVPPTRTQ